MAPNTVHVTNIAAATSDKEIRDFFSFCGKITDLQVTPAEKDTKNATVLFEKEAAAKTAHLLNNTQLGTAQISVTPEDTSDDAGPTTTNADRDSDEITQEEKPRSRILAEYIAHGYVISEAALQRGLELDQKHGVTSRFMSTLQNLDAKYHATDRAKAANQSYGVSQRANALFGGLSSYFEKATNTPTGKKLVDFYTQGQRQVVDVHNEAMRLKKFKIDEAGGSASRASGFEKVFGKSPEKPTEPTPATSSKYTTSGMKCTEQGKGCNCSDHGETCTCVAGECKCDHCVNSKTSQVCQCIGEGTECTCEPSKCACKGCAKVEALHGRGGCCDSEVGRKPEGCGDVKCSPAA